MYPCPQPLICGVRSHIYASNCKSNSALSRGQSHDVPPPFLSRKIFQIDRISSEYNSLTEFLGHPPNGVIIQSITRYAHLDEEPDDPSFNYVIRMIRDEKPSVFIAYFQSWQGEPDPEFSCYIEVPAEEFDTAVQDRIFKSRSNSSFHSYVDGDIDPDTMHEVYYQSEHYIPAESSRFDDNETEHWAQDDSMGILPKDPVLRYPTELVWRLLSLDDSETALSDCYGTSSKYDTPEYLRDAIKDTNDLILVPGLNCREGNPPSTEEVIAYRQSRDSGVSHEMALAWAGLN